MSEPENELEQRFPNMRPIRSMPTLSTVNGIGCMLIGGRDHDPETGTYIKTHAFCLLFVPLLNLGAYRVANAPQGGWYFIGREPLSGLARAWNWMVLCLVLGGIGLGLWINHTNSPEYQARKKVAEADRLAEAGEVKEAAKLYREVARGSTSEAGTAAGKFKDLLGGPLDGVSLEKALPVLRMGAEWDRRKDIQATTFQRGLALAKDKGTAEPQQALAVLDLIAPLAEKQDDFAKERLPLLEKLAASHPDDVAIVSILAVTHERLGDTARCEKLLLPLRDRLGASEGARVLGQIFARQGKDEESFKLLVPYTDEKLQKIETAAQTIKDTHETIKRQLNQGNPPNFPLERYKAADKKGRDAIVMEYVQSRLEGDTNYQEAQAVLTRMGPAVDAAMDLGLVRLGRARNMKDPAARREELEKAEKTLLAVRGAAGETVGYNFRLGQVYYWMGKHEQGRKLFDDVLAKQNRSFETLMVISNVLREVGEVADARKLAEEAHGKDVDQKKKWAAALQRSLMYTDNDDRITWLEQSDPSNEHVKADLETARGEQAAQKGLDEEAAKHFREAIDVYARAPENAGTLNNAAIVYGRLYGVTGDVQALDKSLAMFEKAVTQSPGDSILLNNLVGELTQAAARDFIGKRIDIGALRSRGGLSYLRYLYRDAPGQRQFTEAARKHPGVLRALIQADRLVLLAPKGTNSYALAAAMHLFRKDVAALRRLEEALREAGLDHSDDHRELKEQLEGKNEARLKEERKVSVARWEKRVEQLRKGGGPTFAVAACTLAAALQDEAGEPDRAVRLVEEAHAASPSRATHDALISALLFRAHQRLGKQNPDYAGLVKRSRRLLGASYLLALSVERGGKLLEAALADKDFCRACDLLKEQGTAFPDDADPWGCVLLRAAHPAAADKMLAALKKDEAGRLARAIGLKLAPTSASAALGSYWTLKLEGKEAEGKAILKACAARGVPLPIDLN
jgi:tetratricopeptide (TPR) repeat protein